MDEWLDEQIDERWTDDRARYIDTDDRPEIHGWHTDKRDWCSPALTATTEGSWHGTTGDHAPRSSCFNPGSSPEPFLNSSV